MKMFVTSIVVLFLFSFGGRIRCGSTVETVSVSVNESCSPWETDCALGCCPFKDGVCCSDGFECCEHGKTCIPFIGICVGAVNNNGEISLTSSQSTSVRSSVFKCPPGTTECAPGKCCEYSNAVCCLDGIHCCPQAFKCDLKARTCIPDTDSKISRYLYTAAAFDVPLTKLSRKSPYKSCLGGGRMCPNYMSCCVNDEGEWGCCPNPSLRQIRYGGGQCCDTIFGHMCCPDDYPVCTVIGCTK